MGSNLRFYLLTAFFVVLVAAAWWLLGDYGSESDRPSAEGEGESSRVAESVAAGRDRPARVYVDDGQEKKHGVASSARTARDEPQTARRLEEDLAGNGVIRGVVTHSGAGPAAAATVTLIAEASPGVGSGFRVVHRSVVHADSTGKYEATQLPVDKQYQLKAVTATEFSAQRIYLSRTRPEIEVDFRLEEGGPIEGWVRDEANAPIPDASLYPSQQEGREGPVPGLRAQELRGLTDAQGHFSVHVNPGNWRFFVKADGYAPLETPFFAVGKRDAEIVLARGGSISGTVVDDDGAPVVNAGVLAWPTSDYGYAFGSSEARSGAGGEFTLTGLADGTYHLMLTGPNSQGWDRESATEITLEVGEHKTDLRLVYSTASKVAISGRVTAASGNPVAGASVRAHGRGPVRSFGEVQTDADGNYTITGLQNVEHYVSVSHPAFSAENRDGVLGGSRNVDFLLEARGTIEGRVVSRSSSQPVTSFDIMYAEGRRTGLDPEIQRDFMSISDPDGAFRLEGIDVGEVTVFVRASGYEWGNVLAEIRRGQPSVNLLVRLDPCAAVEGIVTDTHRAPLEGALVFAGASPPDESARAHSALARTSADGAFRIDSLPPDTRVLSAHHPDFKEGSAPITDGSVHIVLNRGAAIEGYVRVGGQPASGIRILAFAANGTGDVQTASTDADGSYALRSLAPDVMRVQAYYPDGLGRGRRLDRQAILEEDRVTEVNFDFPEGTASISGAVIAENIPPRSIRVELSFESAAGTQEMTAPVQGPDGACFYSFENLPAGTCTLTAQARPGPSIHRAAPVTLEVRAGQTVRQDIVFPIGGTVSGEVSGRLSDGESGVAILRGTDPLPTLTPASYQQIIMERALGVTQITPGSTGYVIEHVEPGTHTAVAFSMPRDASSESETLSGLRVATARVEVRDNEESRVDLRLP